MQVGGSLPYLDNEYGHVFDNDLPCGCTFSSTDCVLIIMSTVSSLVKPHQKFSSTAASSSVITVILYRSQLRFSLYHCNLL